jgi:DNA-binding response OmpR family regulator
MKVLLVEDDTRVSGFVERGLGDSGSRWRSRPTAGAD